MKWRSYPKQKESGVAWLGDIPDSWQLMPLFSLMKERFIKNIYGAEDNVLSLSYGKIIQRDTTDNFGLLPESFETYQIVEPNNIILRLTDLQNDKRSLRVGIVDQRGIITSAYVCLEFKQPSQLSARFAFYLLHSYDISKIFYSLGGGVRQSMRYEDLKWLQLLKPSLYEQRTIAAFLDRETARIDQLLAKKEQQIELLQEKRSAIISHAVTKGLHPKVKMKDSGVEWLGKIPEHWEAAPLYSKYYVQLGKMLDSKRITGDHLAPYLRNVDVQWGKINTEVLPLMDFTPDDRQRFALQLGDLLVCEGGDVGRTAEWQGEISECYYQKALHRLRPLRGDISRYVYYVMHAATHLGVFLAGADVSTIGHLTGEKLRRHRFPFPPIQEQEQIVKYLDNAIRRIDLIHDKVKDSMTILDEYRTALISAAVSGKIDVRKEVA